MGTKAESNRTVQEKSGEERRLARRVLTHLEVDIANENNYLFAYITDISSTGIFVRTTTPESPGTLLQLRFTPEHGAAIEVEGEVVWVNPFRPSDSENIDPGMGIRFRSLTDDLRVRLDELVKKTALIDKIDKVDPGNSTIE